MRVRSLAKTIAVAVLPHPVRFSLKRRLRYRRNFGRPLRLSRATTFTDKVNWRIMRDRRALLEGTCDKLAMKGYAESLAGDLVRVPQTYWVGTDVAELAGVELPERWVIKPNHSTGLVHLGEGQPDVAELARTTEGWLEDDHWRRSGQRAYRSARRALIVEEFIGEPGDFPPDLKVYVFDGVPRLVQVHSGRSTGHLSRIYTPEWQPRPWSGGYPPGPDVPRPRRAAEMFEAASRLAQGFDMLRVDFYEHDGVLWFGEITPYPGGGMVKVDRAMDEELGRWWSLPDRTSGGERVVDAEGGQEVVSPARGSAAA